MRKFGLMVVVALLFLATGCQQNPSEEVLYQKLVTYFQNGGYACELTACNESQTVAIHQPESWKILRAGEEDILVYFDQSNRADYLSTTIDPKTFGTVTHFGLRFVLVYEGENEEIIDLMKQIPQV